ncbi:MULTISPECIES: hypothetical protein [Micrococcaceae]|uniref:hypothetical protein n=1 Tax=Micrococcaceae TaxID=1268 RepID=UPI00339AEAB8
MFQSRCISHLAYDVVGEEFEFAVGKLIGKGGEQVVQLLLSGSTAPSTHDTHGFVAGPECPARGGITVVDGQFSL